LVRQIEIKPICFVKSETFVKREAQDGMSESVNEPSAENPEGMGEQEPQAEVVGMECCVAEEEGRGSSTDFAAAAR
jgi:hypothetical protein